MISKSPAFAPGFLFASRRARHTLCAAGITHPDDEARNLDDAKSL
jgi:hypothetical protein